MNLFIKILIVLVIIIAVIGIVIFFMRKKVAKMGAEQQTMINSHRQTVSLFIIDKKKTKITEGTFPKNIMAQFPKYMKWRKLPLVKARVNNRMMTFICEDKIFQNLPTGKIIKVDIAGLYIVEIKSKK